jgi:hypothetical protein
MTEGSRAQGKKGRLKMGRSFELGQAWSYNRGEFSGEMSPEPRGAGRGCIKKRANCFIACSVSDKRMAGSAMT